MNAEYGSTCTENNIYLSTGLNIEIIFVLSQNGIYTSKVLKVDTFGFFGVSLGAISGGIGLIAILMMIYEYAYNWIKYRNYEWPSYFKDEYERKIRIKQKRKN